MGRNPEDQATRFAIHLLDVGREQYGDAILCELGTTTVLIDGAHPGNWKGEEGHAALQDQIAALLGQESSALQVSLLVVTHGHNDHIGCLPALVDKGWLKAEWALVSDPKLAWGRLADEDVDAGVPEDAEIRRFMAAIREEPLPRDLSPARVEAFLADALTLETRYTNMIQTLEGEGTRVVRFGRENPAELKKAFRGVGLEILGPSQELVLKLAEEIRGLGRDALDAAERVVKRDGVDALEASRAFMDAKKGPGPAINGQSIVLSFTYKGRRLLFSGDSQLAEPEVQDAEAAGKIRALATRVLRAGPYDFVKIGHHGSYNAFSEDFFGQASTFGICAGEESTSHPNPKILKLLQKHKSEIHWARTDRNGQVTFAWQGADWKITPERGRLNDPTPNTQDEEVSIEPRVEPEVVPARPEPPTVQAQPPITATVGGEVIEVSVRVPKSTGRVTIQIDVQGSPTGGTEPIAVGPARDRTWRLGGGRKLPTLLFVTNRAELARNIGSLETSEVLAELGAAGHRVLDVATAGGVANAVRSVRKSLDESVRGVVLLGGYDVVPAQNMDCLPSDLRREIGRSDDPDDFQVWSDAIYGDRDGDGMGEIPVSRIPDGKTAALVRQALSAGWPSTSQKKGIRNIARPFAQGVYDVLPGNGKLPTSQPLSYRDGYSLLGDSIYLMLHGSYSDGTVFSGEDGAGLGLDAVRVDNVPRSLTGSVILAGCCWGALTVAERACVVRGGTGIAPAVSTRTPEQALALRFLASGANAFVGCTGAHYSPVRAPYDYYGGPMHAAFWRGILKGLGPAESLLQARNEYVRGMPHGRKDPEGHAIEFKLLHQFTCLGLGW